MSKVVNVSPEDIIIKERARKDFSDINSLKESIQEIGLINPISVNDKYELLAGECRLRAMKELNYEEIPVRVFKGISPMEESLIEYFENVARNSFLWHEELLFKKKLHDEWSENNEEWSIRKTATKLNCSSGGLSSDIDLAKGIEYFPTLIECKTKKKAREAYKKILSRAKAQHTIASMGDEDKEKLSSLLGDSYQKETNQNETPKKEKALGGIVRPKPLRVITEEEPNNDDIGTSDNPPNEPTEDKQDAVSSLIDKLQYSYKICDSLDLIEELPDNFFGFAELDPPYAIDYNKLYSQANQEATETDWTVDQYRSRMSTLVKALHSKMMDDTFVLIWTGVEHFEWLNVLGEESGFSVQKPGIWVKPGGSSNSPSTSLISNYEMYLIFRKGHPTFNVASMKAAIQFDSVPFSKRSHQWEKPVEMYRYFIHALGMQGQHMFSPFAGSGTAMLAALHEGMIPIGCDTKTQYYYSFMERLNKEFGHGI